MRASHFRSDEARAAYCRLYDEAVAAAPVPVEELDFEGRFGLTHVVTAGDRGQPARVYLLDAVGDLNKSVARERVVVAGSRRPATPALDDGYRLRRRFPTDAAAPDGVHFSRG